MLRLLRQVAGGIALCALYGGMVFAQAAQPSQTRETGRNTAASDEGIPVTDPLVIARCGGCHTRDERGNMQRISWSRATPEGWQDTIKQMILANGLSLTLPEARSIVRYLSSNHGLAPEEARPVMYDPERRIQEETNIPSERLRQDCARCHAFARSLEWRRSAGDWKEFAASHAASYKTRAADEAVEFLVKAAALRTPEWEAWRGRKPAPKLAGIWLVSAYAPGEGAFYGQMQIEDVGDDEYTTRADLRSVRDGSRIVRSGRGMLFGGYSWRGRSSGGPPPGSTPNDLSSEAREVMWFAPDRSFAEGRWFWGQYQEFGFDVKLFRPTSAPMLIALDTPSLRAGSQSRRIRMLGDQFPPEVTTEDLHFGPGVAVRRVVSHTASEIVVEVDVAPSAVSGKRDVALGNSVLPGVLVVYDRIDYVEMRPNSTVAAFGDNTHPKGYQQFEAIGYQRGPDGRLHTADDLDLGPVDATYSVEVFHAAEGASSAFVGAMTPGGLFIPADKNPNNNFDCWVVATAKEARGSNGAPLVGKSYLVVTVPTYVFNGRRYVRDLDRWLDDGPALGGK
jgi:quinohemoprotein amine dehydrogenase